MIAADLNEILEKCLTDFYEIVTNQMHAHKQAHSTAHVPVPVHQALHTQNVLHTNRLMF